MSSPEHRTVSRVMAILEVVVASEPQGLRLADLADAVSAPKSSIHGLAKGLVTTGYLREAAGRYHEGPAVALLTSGTPRVPPAYHRALEMLSRRWNETAILATLVGDGVMNIAVVEAEQMIRASPPVNVRRPLWPVSYGKNFLAFMEPRRRDAYVRRKFSDPAERARVVEQLETIRKERVAYNREEDTSGLYGVSSPIVRLGSEVTLAIGLVGPAERMRPREADLTRDVRDTASALGEDVNV